MSTISNAQEQEVEKVPPFYPPTDSREEALNMAFMAIENAKEWKYKDDAHALKHSMAYNVVSLSVAVNAINKAAQQPNTGLRWVDASKILPVTLKYIPIKFESEGEYYYDAARYDEDGGIFITMDKLRWYKVENVQWLYESSAQPYTVLGWVEASEVPELINGESNPVLVKYEKYPGKIYHRIAYYFPYHFKTVEYEYWDDYDEKDYPYTENDTEKGCVWLRPGFYDTVECEKCEGYWDSPLKVISWIRIPD